MFKLILVHTVPYNALNKIHTIEYASLVHYQVTMKHFIMKWFLKLRNFTNMVLLLVLVFSMTFLASWQIYSSVIVAYDPL